MSLPGRAVVSFYNKRGTAEQWIQEGKQATDWDALNGVTTAAFTINVDKLAPALFILPEVIAGPDRAIAQNFPDFSLNTPFSPVPAGGIVVVYLIGIGEVTNPVPTGQAAPVGSPLSVAANPFSATIGGEDATVAFLGLTPGAVALPQANITCRPIWRLETTW